MNKNKQDFVTFVAQANNLVATSKPADGPMVRDVLRCMLMTIDGLKDAFDEFDSGYVKLVDTYQQLSAGRYNILPG